MTTPSARTAPDSSSALLVKLLTSPVSAWADVPHCVDAARAAQRWVRSWRPPPDPSLSPSRVLPGAVRDLARAVATSWYLPDRDLLVRALDHEVVDRMVVDFLTRLLAAFAHHRRGSGDPAPGRGAVLGKLPLGRMTDGLGATLSGQIMGYARTHRAVVAQYLVEILTLAEELPEFARWRGDLVDLFWASPIQALVPRRPGGPRSPDQATLVAMLEGALAEIGDRSLLDLYDAAGFDHEATLAVARSLDRWLAAAAERVSGRRLDGSIEVSREQA